MKRFLALSFLLLGISSVIAQAILLRELTITFYGNEFFIALILAAWLFWAAVGSRAAEKIKILDRPKIFLALHLLAWVLLALAVVLIRLSKNWFGGWGEIPNLAASLFLAWFFPLPVSLLLGFWWTSATRVYAGNSPIKNTNRAYFLETLGFILGGILFSFVLVNIPSSFIIPESLRFKNQALVETTNSAYGNIAVTKTGKQYNFYESGLLLDSTENVEFAEIIAHLTLLQHPAPQKILVLGNGFNGVVSEILKHPVENIHYLELDPKLIEVSQKYLSPASKQALDSPKVKVIKVDGRYYLNQTKEKFDVILLNLPDPSTALINRFYTKQFFELASKKLNENGIFSVHLSFSPSAPGENLENLNVSIFKTLKTVFRQVIILPEEKNFFFASKTNNLTYNPEPLIERFRERDIQTKFLSPAYIAYRLSDARSQQILDRFEKNQEAEKNSDLKPIAYFYQMLFWFDHFYPRFSRFFKNFAFCFWLISIVVLTILSFLLSKKKQLSKKLPLFSVTVAGFSLMALETTLIFNYQITVGYLYHRIALLISGLMAGMAFGVWYGNKTCRGQTPATGKSAGVRPPMNFHLYLVLFCTVLFFIFLLVSKIPLALIKEIVFLLLAIIAGFLGAVIFPFANQIYLSQQTEPNKKTGVIYSADLFGSCLGALLTGLILIPVFGVWQTLFFVALVNLWLILVSLKWQSG